MSNKRAKPEEIVTKLRQVEVLVGHPCGRAPKDGGDGAEGGSGGVM